MPPFLGVNKKKQQNMTKKHTKDPWYPVEIAGHYMLLDSDDYSGGNLLDESECSKAKANSELAAASPLLLDEHILNIKRLGAVKSMIKKGSSSSSIELFINLIIASSNDVIMKAGGL